MFNVERRREGKVYTNSRISIYTKKEEEMKNEGEESIAKFIEGNYNSYNSYVMFWCSLGRFSE